MSELSYDNEQRAADVLAHYLKETGASLGDGTTDNEVKKAARNIRAAFEELENPGQDDRGMSMHINDPRLQKAIAEFGLAQQRLSRELPFAATSSQPSPRKGQSEDAHRS